MLQFFKSRFVRAGVFSVPMQLLGFARQPGDFTPAHMQSMDLVKSMSVHPGAGQTRKDLALFQVVDAFPERKYQVRSIHVEKKMTEITVSVLNVFAQHHGGVSADGAGHHVRVVSTMVVFGKYTEISLRWLSQKGFLGMAINNWFTISISLSN